MASQSRLEIIDSTRLPSNVLQMVREVILGPQKPKAPHSNEPPFVLDPARVGEVIYHHLPNVRTVLLRSTRQEPYDAMLALPAVTSDVAHAFVVRPCLLVEGALENAGGSVASVRVALPRNKVLSPNALPADARLLPTSDLRLVSLHVFSLMPTRGGLPGAGRQPEDIRETVLHIRCEETLTEAGRFLRMYGRSIEDLTIRACDAVSLVGKRAAALSGKLHLGSCIALASLTLCLTLLPGATPAVELQQQLLVAILRDVPARGLRRLRIGFVLLAGGLCHRTMGQLKATPWRAIGDALKRFAALETVAIAVKGEEVGDSEVWLEAQRGCKLVVSDGVQVVFDQGCIF